MGRPRTSQADPFEQIDHRALQELLQADGRSGAELLRALREHEPPIRLSSGVWSRLVSGAQASTRRSIRLAIEEELLGYRGGGSPLLGEISASDALKDGHSFRIERELVAKGCDIDAALSFGEALNFIDHPAIAGTLLFGARGNYSEAEREEFRAAALGALLILVKGLPDVAVRSLTLSHVVAIYEAIGFPAAVAGMLAHGWEPLEDGTERALLFVSEPDGVLAVADLHGKETVDDAMAAGRLFRVKAPARPFFNRDAAPRDPSGGGEAPAPPEKSGRKSGRAKAGKGKK